MAKLMLFTNPASRGPADLIITGFAKPDPFPVERVDVRTADDAAAALADYAERVKATGAAARASMKLEVGERAPRGFKALQPAVFVNL